MLDTPGYRDEYFVVQSVIDVVRESLGSQMLYLRRVVKNQWTFLRQTDFRWEEVVGIIEKWWEGQEESQEEFPIQNHGG